VCLLDAFPWAADRTTGEIYRSHPLHLACRNASCSMSIIQLLAKKNPSALRHSSSEFCVTGPLIYEALMLVHRHNDVGVEVVGLPLHCYLGRRSNMDIDTVKILLDAYPEALTTAGETGSPLHVLLANPSIADCCDIFQFLVEAAPSSLQMTDRHDRVPLHVACFNGNMNLKIVQILIHAWPEATRSRDGHLDHDEVFLGTFLFIYFAR